MGRKLAELRVVGSVLAGAGNEESAPGASQINQPADVRQKALRSLDVESAAGKDEIALQINLPKNGLNRDGQGIAPPCLSRRDFSTCLQKWRKVNAAQNFANPGI